jgi:hypothetical protein
MSSGSSEAWWPPALSHISRERPWDAKHVVVAEIRSFPGNPHAGQRILNSALVPQEHVGELKTKLRNLGHEVSASGPRPSPRPGSSYEPRFWISATELPSEKYEPLVLSWSSHNKTVLLPDPRFLMTYGLSSRTGENGSTRWDDPTRPVYDVVTVDAPSVWDFPLATTATVSIARDYLQDYLSLRRMALVHVFWEMRYGPIDEHAAAALGDDESVSLYFADRTFQLNRTFDDRKVFVAQVWGARIIGLPDKLPITEDLRQKKGLTWPGFETPVTSDMAMRMTMADTVYVDDAVLAEFEGKHGYRTYPKNGSVSFGTQWSVGFSTRVGRNLIRLELKKLYEGAPFHVISHWNKYAVEPLSETAYPAALYERNIAVRAEELTFAVVSLGESLSALATSAGLDDHAPEDFVSLRRAALDYYGWWTFEHTEPISRHVPLSSSIDSLLERCVALDKLIVEGLSEAKLRKLLHVIGASPESIANFGSLKLLDCIVRMAQVAISTGLRLSKDGKRIWDRLAQEATKPPQPISQLFALYDLRVLKAHKIDGQHRKAMEELKRFGISAGEEVGGYGKIMDKIYDALAIQLREITEKLRNAN